MPNFQLFICLLADRVFLCSPGYPRTYFVDQAGRELRGICLSLPPVTLIFKMF